MSHVAARASSFNTCAMVILTNFYFFLDLFESELPYISKSNFESCLADLAIGNCLAGTLAWIYASHITQGVKSAPAACYSKHQPNTGEHRDNTIKSKDLILPNVLDVKPGLAVASSVHSLMTHHNY